MTKQLIDLSHIVEEGVITYKGLPAPIICDYISREKSRDVYAPGTEFHIGKIEMVANTGTYLDSPFHRYADGKDLSQLPLSSLADLNGVVIDATSVPVVDASAFERVDLNGKAVLVKTGWSKHWNTDQYFEGHPYLSREAAEFLRDSGVKLVGIDSLNIDSIEDLSRPVHTILLGNDIPVVEHMTNLDSLPGQEFRFHAVPVKVKNFGTFPVRAYGVVN